MRIAEAGRCQAPRARVYQNTVCVTRLTPATNRVSRTTRGRVADEVAKIRAATLHSTASVVNRASRWATAGKPGTRRSRMGQRDSHQRHSSTSVPGSSVQLAAWRVQTWLRLQPYPYWQGSPTFSPWQAYQGGGELPMRRSMLAMNRMTSRRLALRRDIVCLIRGATIGSSTSHPDGAGKGDANCGTEIARGRHSSGQCPTRDGRATQDNRPPA